MGLKTLMHYLDEEANYFAGYRDIFLTTDRLVLGRAGNGHCERPVAAAGGVLDLARRDDERHGDAGACKGAGEPPQTGRETA
jgi:hypothetical protein